MFRLALSGRVAMATAESTVCELTTEFSYNSVCVCVCVQPVCVCNLCVCATRVCVCATCVCNLCVQPVCVQVPACVCGHRIIREELHVATAHGCAAVSCCWLRWYITCTVSACEAAGMFVCWRERGCSCDVHKLWA